MSVTWEAYFAAIRAGKLRSALAAANQAMDAGADLFTVYIEMLQPAMREVGRLWQENEMTVADEHLATAITQTVMANLYTRGVGANGVEGPTIVASCADNERHEVGLRMLCDLLELDGWDTTYLGATVPIESLVELVQKARPDVLALSATIAPHVPRVRNAIEAVRDAMDGDAPLIIVGGRPFLERPDLAARVGADETAADARAAVALLNRRLNLRRAAR